MDIQLSPKFDCQIINKSNRELKSQLDQIFSKLPDSIDLLSETNGFKPCGGKAHIVTHPDLQDWVIKGPRNDGVILSCPDTHIYRVRRARRIQSVIARHGFSEVVVPKKYLYEYRGKWFVVAEKLDIDPDASLSSFGLRKKVINGVEEWFRTEKRSLTAQQAHEIALICFEGKLEDVSTSNISFTKKGKIALVDTEPVARAIKKIEKKSFQFIPYLKSTTLFKMAMANSERVFLMPSSGQKEIRQVQSQMFWKHLAKITAKISIPIIISVEALLGAMPLASPVVLVITATCVGIAGLNVLAGLTCMLASTFTYLRVRSEIGHYELQAQ